MDKNRLNAGLKKATEFINAGDFKKAHQELEVLLMTFSKFILIRQPPPCDAAKSKM